MTTAGDLYVKSRCRICGGSIEFPAHGLGETVECPHCHERIELARPRLFDWLRRFRLPRLNPAWAVVLAALLLSGTAVGVYLHFRAEAAENARQQALSRFLDQTTADQKRFEQQQEEDRKREELVRIEEAKVEALREANRVAKDNASGAQLTHTLDAIDREAQADRQLGELRAGNQIAREAQFQSQLEASRRQQADQQRNDALHGINRELGQMRQNQEAQQYSGPTYVPGWVYKYNPYTGEWSYVPPNAQLKYYPFRHQYQWQWLR